MAFFSIPPDQLENIILFGYEKIEVGETKAHVWYYGPRGRTKIDKANPTVWLEDEADAIQLGATSVVVGPNDPKKTKMKTKPKTKSKKPAKS